MDKKPGLLFSVYALAMIILASVFKFNLFNENPDKLTNTANVANHLFVCPMTSNTWDSISNMLSKGEEYISMGVAFVVIVLLFSWGWALYQNLLKDKFSADVYKNPWEITKIAFWATVICIVLVKTPNYFRPKAKLVRQGGEKIEFVLCENTSENAKAVPVRSK